MIAFDFYAYLPFIASSRCAVFLLWQTYPLMPPRLVPSCDDFGGCLNKEYRWVDTMDVYGGLWSWKDKGVADLSNHYAAMPSMHTGYAAWTCVSVFTTSHTYKWLQVCGAL